MVKEGERTRTVCYYSGLHPIQESIVEFPPEGYSIHSNVGASDFERVSIYSPRNVAIKGLGTRMLNLIQRPRLMYVRQKCDLIHTGSGVFPINRKPFVVNAECYASFLGMQFEKVVRGGFRRNVVKHLNSPYCKRILPFSEASKLSLLNAFAPESRTFERKLEVLYPAIAPQPIPKQAERDDETVRVLIIGRGFFEKGARELFRAVEKLREEKLKVELVAVTDARPFYQKEVDAFVGRYVNREGFTIHSPNIPRSVLFRDFYHKSDIFAMPSYGDLFGYVYLEAMACGLPLIGSRVFAIPEIVADGENGFLVDVPVSPWNPNMVRKPEDEVVKYLSTIIGSESLGLTAQLTDKLRVLVEDEGLRRRMGKKSLEMVTDGRFSIARRNKILKAVYDDALAG